MGDPGRDQGNMAQRRLMTTSASVDIPIIGLKSVLAPFYWSRLGTEAAMSSWSEEVASGSAYYALAAASSRAGPPPLWRSSRKWRRGETMFTIFSFTFSPFSPQPAVDCHQGGVFRIGGGVCEGMRGGAGSKYFSFVTFSLNSLLLRNAVNT